MLRYADRSAVGYRYNGCNAYARTERTTCVTSSTLGWRATVRGVSLGRAGPLSS